MILSKDYSFCESVWATSISPWCIRELTSAGKKLGGGIDTPSLCGRCERSMGWDLAPNAARAAIVCPSCLSIYHRERR